MIDGQRKASAPGLPVSEFPRLRMALAPMLPERMPDGWGTGQEARRDHRARRTLSMGLPDGSEPRGTRRMQSDTPRPGDDPLPPIGDPAPEPQTPEIDPPVEPPAPQPPGPIEAH
jgi:hypothetical protein